MEALWADIIKQWSKKCVVVVGEAMLDRYLVGMVERLGREAVVPIVEVERQETKAGGAANTAVNLAALGAQVCLVSWMGQDPSGREMRRILTAHGVKTEGLLFSPKRQTLVKQRILGNGHILMRTDWGTTTPLTRAGERLFIKTLKRTLIEADALIVSDYGYGLMTPGVITALTGFLREREIPVAIDAKEPKRYRDWPVMVVKPNYDQAIQLLRLPVIRQAEKRVAQIRQAGRRILSLTRSQIAAVTMDAAGAWVFEKGNGAYRTYAAEVDQKNTIGAGDTYLAVLVLALLGGASMPTAAEMASAAAKQVVASDLTVTCSAQDLLNQDRLDRKQILSRRTLARLVRQYKEDGRRVVFTNGCFDLLHRGHVTYLNQAKALGDILIVGVNSDDSVRRLKGPERPINQLDDRLEVLTGLSSVDHVIGFEEDTPVELIKIVQPHIFVKGGDYREETLPEAKWVKIFGGRVEILPYLHNRSTTKMIKRIRAKERGYEAMA